jgi:hypothetical protein
MSTQTKDSRIIYPSTQKIRERIRGWFGDHRIWQIGGIRTITRMGDNSRDQTFLACLRTLSSLVQSGCILFVGETNGSLLLRHSWGFEENVVHELFG